MKTKTVGMLVAMSLSNLAFAALLSSFSAHACTVFCDGQGGAVFAGCSFDIPDNTDLGLLFVPASARTHGWVCGARFAYPWADGMNDQGLFVAVADVPTPFTTTSSRQPADLQTLLGGLLANCATVDEAIQYCRKQPTPSLAGEVHHFLGLYTFDTPEHILVADRSGDSVVFEWEQGKLKMIRTRGRYQLMTNFLLTDPKAGDYPDARYVAGSKVLDETAEPSLQTCKQVLETTAQGITRYSLICDLTHGDIYVYLRQRFDQTKTFHLADELKKDRHEFDLDQWFGRPKPGHLSLPRVIAVSATTYDEYVGQYRKSFLFGLLHLGPTLSVSHTTNKPGDRLIVSVRGVVTVQSWADVGEFVPVKTNSFAVDPEYPRLTDDKIQLTFVRVRKGKATRVVVNWNGRIVSAARISDEPANRFATVKDPKKYAASTKLPLQP